MKKIFNAILSLLMFVAGGITAVCGLTLFFWGRARIDHVFAYVLTCAGVGPSLKFAFGLWIALGAILFAIACRYYKKFALVAQPSSIPCVGVKTLSASNVFSIVC